MAKERIDDYELIAPLGTGTVGTVYRAKNTKTGQDVALKILIPSVATNPEIAARFQREIEVLERLSHPNIVQYFGSGRHNGRLYYTMEIVDGGSLKDLLNKEGRLPWQDVIEIGWQICSALQHAHNLGIIHRDLKPANLFFTKDNRLKLGDFGLALDMTAAAELTATGLTVGTYLYMAPEQIRGERTISNKTDLYALGCLMFRLLAGRPPFEGSNFAQIFDSHLHATPPSVRVFTPNCPRELEAVVLQMLEKDQEKRPLNAREVQGRIAEVLMKWDEEQAEKVLKKKSKTWAIETGKPILSRIRESEKSAKSKDISWAFLGGLIGAVVLVLYLISQASK
ncbi:serine/threonine protein kinase [Lacunimicrobium album]|jgi:serine/threonine protein kinase